MEKDINRLYVSFIRGLLKEIKRVNYTGKALLTKGDKTNLKDLFETLDRIENMLETTLGNYGS